jgi:hypothetical protein
VRAVPEQARLRASREPPSRQCSVSDATAAFGGGYGDATCARLCYTTPSVLSKLTPPDMSRSVTLAALIRAFRGLGLTAVVCLLATGCRDRRTLEELEQSIAPGAVSQQPTGETDLLLAGYQRVARLFAADASSFLGPTSEPLSPRTGLAHAISLEVSQCYTFLAYAQPESVDADLSLIDPEGRVVMRDASPDPYPVIQGYCAPATGQYTLRITSARGAGEIRWGVFVVPEGERAAAAQQIHALQQEHAPAGQPLSALTRTYLYESESKLVPVVLRARECAVVLGVGLGNLTDLDLLWLDPSGEEVHRAVGLDARPVLTRYCAPETGAYRLSLTAYAGGGVAFWRVYRVESPAL